MLGADCCFAGGEGTANELPVLMVIDSETSTVFAHVFRKNVLDAGVVDAMMEDIDVLGHREDVLKGDQGTSIKALQPELAARGPEMKLENTADKNTRPRVENAVQRVIGSTHVLDDALEAHIKQAVGSNMSVKSFMMSHAAAIINRRSVDPDGRTRMQRAWILFQPRTLHNETNELDVEVQKFARGLSMGCRRSGARSRISVQRECELRIKAEREVDVQED